MSFKFIHHMSMFPQEVLSCIGCEDGVKVVKYTVQWKIENWKGPNVQQEICLQSPFFWMGDNNEFEACIFLYPGDAVGNLRGYIAIYLQLNSNNEQNMKGQLEFATVVKGIKHHTIKIPLEVNNLIAPHRYGTDYFSVSSSSPSFSNFLDDEGNVTISVDMLLKFSSVASFQQANAFQLKVLDNYSTMLKNQKFCDVTITADGEHLLKAHKVVLAAQSPVFEAMFESNMSETQTNVIDIIDIDLEVLKAMLLFMYTGKVGNLADLAEGLIVAADKYQVDGLRLICEEFLMNNISEANALTLLNIADLHSAHHLKNRAIRFLNRHIKQIDQVS